MNVERDRDHKLEQALTLRFGRSSDPVELRRDDDVSASAACLDAETLAAWMDGALDRNAVALAEAHAVSCPQCRALVRVMAQPVAVEAHDHDSRPRLWWWWLAPLFAATIAAALWVIVPPDATPPAVEISPALPRAAHQISALGQTAAFPKPLEHAPQKLDTSPERAGSVPDVKLDSTVLDEANQLDVQKDDGTGRGHTARSEEPASPRPPSLIVTHVAASTRVDAVEVASPDPAIRWRASVRGIELSIDVGRTWKRVALATTVTAGSSPSPEVCWLVGRGGTVLLTIDARAFTRLPFPEADTLVAIRAVDARVATVMAAGGTTFETQDGGQTWVSGSTTPFDDRPRHE